MIRGAQLGNAIHATVDVHCKDFKGYELVIGVKRVPKDVLNAIRKSGRPWVWDIVDAYPQPLSNNWSQDQALQWLKDEIQTHQPSAMVFPTTRMYNDSEFAGPSLVLPHHAWPKYRKQTIRPKVKVLGYEGGEHYLGKWGPLLNKICAARNWSFQINQNLEDADIGIALRDPLNYASRNWKSNVKVANLQALGLPIICTNEVSHFEFGGDTVITVSSEKGLNSTLDHLQDYDLRMAYGDTNHKSTPTLQHTAREYQQWLAQLRF